MLILSMKLLVKLEVTFLSYLLMLLDLCEQIIHELYFNLNRKWKITNLFLQFK